MNYLDYYRAIQGSLGLDTEKDCVIREAQERLSEDLKNSVNYVHDAKRNGITQKLIITPSNVKHKYNIEAFPNEELYVGDVIEAYNETFIVTETYSVKPIQVTGVIWLCNLDLHFQNFTSPIITRKAVLDSGEYSTTLSNNEAMQTLNKQYRLYLPLDEDTEKIFVDKRFATGRQYNSYGEQILEVFQVTGLNNNAKSYGRGGHLLVCDIRSDTYNKETDNLDLMLCDYIDDTHPILPLDIIGAKNIICGMQKKYTPSDTTANVNWNVECDFDDKIHTTILNNDLTIKIDDDESIIGKQIIIQMSAEGYETAELIVKVVAF